MARPSLRAEIDGVGESAGQALYDVRLEGADACLAGVTAALVPDGRSAPPSGAGFVRADLAGKRAEGGERGLPPAAMRRMACALTARR